MAVGNENGRSVWLPGVHIYWAFRRIIVGLGKRKGIFFQMQRYSESGYNPKKSNKCLHSLQVVSHL